MIRNITKRLRSQSLAVLSRWISLIGIIAIGAVIGLGLAGYGGDDATTPGGDTVHELEGTIHISTTENGPAVTTAALADGNLYAVFSGSEIVDYEWEKDGTVINEADAASRRQLLVEPGNYKVTVFSSTTWSDGLPNEKKTSASVTVTNTARVSISVDASWFDGKGNACKVTFRVAGASFPYNGSSNLPTQELFSSWFTLSSEDEFDDSIDGLSSDGDSLNCFLRRSYSTSQPGAVTVTLNTDKLDEIKSYLVARVRSEGYIIPGSTPFAGELLAGTSTASDSDW